MVCGQGTHPDGRACLPDVVCDAGAHPSNGRCAPNVVCGVGSHADGGTCIADDCATSASDAGCPTEVQGYGVRLAATEAPADGFSKTPVLVTETLPDGTGASEPVLLALSDPSKGTIMPSVVTPGPLGATAYVTSCDSALHPEDCLGPVEVTVARPAVPSNAVARSEILTMVPAVGVGSAAPCLGSGDILFFDGDPNDFIHPGTSAIRLAVFTATATPAAGVQTVAFRIIPFDPALGDDWELTFSSAQLGVPLQQQVYLHVQRAAFAQPGHAGLEIAGDHRGCDQVHGRFQVEQLLMREGTLASFTATFEQYCDFNQALHGCIHFEQ